jgi:hypothetical protein
MLLDFVSVELPWVRGLEMSDAARSSMITVKAQRCHTLHKIDFDSCS